MKLVIGLMMRRRRSVMIARAVVNDDDIICRDDTADQRHGHHTDDKGGKETHISSLQDMSLLLPYTSSQEKIEEAKMSEEVDSPPRRV